MSKLLIVESPAKAKTISKYLDGKYIVRASVGHVRDLPKSNKKAIDIDGGFVPHYEISKGKEKVVAELVTLAKKADEIVLATDPDREGEAIAWHLAEILKDSKKGIAEKIHRVTYNEITKEAITEAMKHPRKIDTALRKAQEARRVLDRLVGYDLSGVIWKKVRYGLSAGRVQSPALRIIMEREREIRAFDPETFWVITADTKTAGGVEIPFVCGDEPRDKKEMERIVSAGEKNNWKITDVKETEAKRSPKAPFITSTLQQTASSRLGMTPARTMQIAQKLYEAGHITYMRTDSTTLSKQALGQIISYIEKEYGKDKIELRTYAKKSKNAQEAHEAIRPSNCGKDIAGNTPEQKKLYRLIWQRTVASQMVDAAILRTKVVANIDNETIPDFSVNGSRVTYHGWLVVDPEARGEDVEVPKVDIGEKLDLEKISTEEKETQPLGRYTEAGLVKELEKRGIGRPSTYASTIKTLSDRGYVEKQGKTLFPTDTGDVVSSFLEEHFAEYISDSFTANMEDELDEIANGKDNYEKVLTDFYKPFLKQVKLKDKLEKITNLGDADPKHKCPTCGKNMIIKLGRSGKFLSCKDFPDCVGARTIDGEELEGPKEIGKPCPDCKDGKLVERDGKYGRFISCNNYPKCKHIEESAEEIERKKTGVKCPDCETGDMVERRGRFGIFYSCSDYPKCKNAIKAKPTGKKCTYETDGIVCGALMMDGTKTIPDRCSRKECPNHNPHKLEDKKKK
ncbi:DNA topoisomerase I [Candidatus Wolfebacteria bacterium]|nr:MAG: DNA topoisomerase I [Candidatus Wolfebacteria bacterium]